MKHYAPSSAAQDKAKASEILFTIFKSVLAEFGMSLSNLAGGTTDAGSDVKAMCVNFLLKQHKISWDWCDCHLADKAAEHAFGTSADPQKSKNKEARRVIQVVIKAAAKVNQSTIFKQKFEEAQLDMLQTVLKITKHAPQRWLSLVRVMERIIRLWHVLRLVYANNGEECPLDKDSNKDEITQLYSLLQPLSMITRDGQYGAVPMTAEIHMAFAELKQDVLDPTKPLKVFDIPATPGSPEAEQAEEENKGKKCRPPLPHAFVDPNKLRPVTVTTREELRKALVQRLYSRLWDSDTPDPSPFRDASVLLTPSYKDIDFHGGLRLTESDAEFLSGSHVTLAPTLDEELASKLDEAWADVKTRASEAARTEFSRSASTGKDLTLPVKRSRALDATGAKKARFASLGRSRLHADNGDVDGLDSEEKVLVQQVAQEIERYQALYVAPEEVGRVAMSLYSISSVDRYKGSARAPGFHWY